MRPKPNTALLIIDVQQGLIDGPPAAIRAPQILAQLNAAIALARSRTMPILFVQHDGPPDSPLAAGSHAWQLHEVLARQPIDKVISKRASDAFCQTTLKAALEQLAIDTLWLAGYASDFCLDSTVRSAAMQGYAVTVIADAHTSKDRPHLGGEQVIAHHNWLWANLDTPTHPVKVIPLHQLAALSGNG